MPTKLLVADDSVTIQKVVNLTFADEDVVVEAVNDGNQAVEKARSMKPDIVLADVFMPGRSGYEVCESIKSDPALARTPVVLLVGTFEPFDESEASRVKCDAYLTKPFDTAELIQTVHSLAGHDMVKEPTMDAPASATPLGAKNLVSARARESFLGSNRILDLFGSQSPALEPAEPEGGEVSHSDLEASEGAAADSIDTSLYPETTESKVASGAAGEVTEKLPETANPQVIPFPGAREAASNVAPVALSQEMLDAIVERVVRKMSQEVVREVAWEVVPELAEIIIRQCLNERGISGKTNADG